MKGQDITEKLIGPDFIRQNLVKMLPGTVLLDTQLNITEVSHEVLRMSLHSESEMTSRYFFDYFKRNGLEAEILDHLHTKGYFQSINAELINRFDKSVNIEISGFYLGMISDINNRIIINVKDLSKLSRYQERLKEKVAEFNELVYRSYHDIRGPLATIKGLVNIGKIEKEKSALNDIINMVGQSANVLENRITNLSEIFESNQPLSDSIRIPKIDVEAFIRQQCQDTDIAIHVSLLESPETLLPDSLPIRKILSSYVDFIFTLEPIAGLSSINLVIGFLQHSLILELEYSGFKCSESLKDSMSKSTLYASETINSEPLLKYYLLKNQVILADGNLELQFKYDYSGSFRILLPSVSLI
ncbi:MAG: hypothetical protein ACFCUU_03675 [Cyclobacteriaceae bacterium]